MFKNLKLLVVANFYRIGSAGLNWKNTGSWSSTSGGVSNGVGEPTNTDAVLFDTNSPATVTVAGPAAGASLSLNKASLVITLNGGSIVISGTTTTVLATVINKTAAETFSTNGSSQNTTGGLSGTAKIILTGGTWQVTGGTNNIANDLDIQGNVTLGTTCRYTTGTLTYVSGTITVTGSTLSIQGACTLNLNGFTLNNLTINFNVTLISNIACSGTLAGGAVLTATTSETITASGGITLGNCSGTVKIIFTGGTWSSGSTIANSIDLQGNVTIGNVRYGNNGTLAGGKTLTYVSGTISCTGTMSIQGSATFNTSGVTWNILSAVGSSAALTLTSNFLAASLTLAANNIVINKTASETSTFTNGITANSPITGTAKIILTGGTWSGSNTTGIGNNMDLQGTITISGNVYYGINTLTYVSGTITVTGSTLNLTSSCTLIGGTYNNITLSNTTALTYTINTTTVTANGTLTIGTGATTTFAGTAGFTCATLSCANTGATTINFKESITYTITTALTCKDSRVGAIVLFTSSHASTKAILTLQNGASNNVLASFTRIDASGGRPIRSFMGVISDCLNVENCNDLLTVSSAA